MKVALVANRTRERVITDHGRPSPEAYGPATLQMVFDALSAAGHEVAEVEGDMDMLYTLERWFGSGAPAGRLPGLVFNMAYGIQGDSRYTHVPAMLEMAGVPYTGAGPLGHAISLDKVVTKDLIQQAGVPTPAYAVMGAPGSGPGGLRPPLVVKPRHESTSFGLQLVRRLGELPAAVDEVVEQYRQEALVEEYVEGREVSIGLLGNDPPELLPPVELDFAGRELHLMTLDDKYHRAPAEPVKVCPAALPPDLLRRLNELALRTFRACHCRDYARVDFRIDSAQRPYVLEINSMASLGASGSFVLGAGTAGYTYAALVERIVAVAVRRYLPGDDRAGKTPCASITGSAAGVSTRM